MLLKNAFYTPVKTGDFNNDIKSWKKERRDRLEMPGSTPCPGMGKIQA